MSTQTPHVHKSKRSLPFSFDGLLALLAVAGGLFALTQAFPWPLVSFAVMLFTSKTVGDKLADRSQHPVGAFFLQIVGYFGTAALLVALGLFVLSMTGGGI